MTRSGDEYIRGLRDGRDAAIQGREFRNFDWAAAEALVDHCLASYGVNTD
jgi:hypothetical protein